MPIESVSSATQTKSQAAGATLAGNFDQFLNLLVTQIKNQDPLDPLDANEFTSQLVQFASVEQQIFQSNLLEKQLSLEENNQVANLVGFIGMTAEVTGKTMPLEGSKGEFTYTMPAGATKGAIIITNSAGATVYNGEVDLTQGKHAFNWDGKSEGGALQPDGAYNVLASATDVNGKLLDITHSVFGRVTGVSVENSDIVLFMGDDITVTQDKLLSVKESKPAV
ncbi:MAG: flagellar hook assembly protein FlgD [Rhodospirillales bacterium]|nr:flagellar hook assembly protein FlgD [Rhodospirillales bacterium]